jgi:DHA1 family tetracycline resistance protein-like MFS transporter
LGWLRFFFGEYILPILVINNCFFMRLLPVLFTVFIDSLGFGLVMPFLAPFLLGPDSMLSEAVTVKARGGLYSCLVASYCLGQFFGGPILGVLSDRHGRKKVLVTTIALSVCSYALGFFSVLHFSIIGLFVSRLLCGVASGNVRHSPVICSSWDSSM